MGLHPQVIVTSTEEITLTLTTTALYFTVNHQTLCFAEPFQIITNKFTYFSKKYYPMLLITLKLVLAILTVASILACSATQSEITTPSAMQTSTMETNTQEQSGSTNCSKGAMGGLFAEKLKEHAYQIGRQLEKESGLQFVDGTEIAVFENLRPHSGLAQNSSNGMKCIQLEYRDDDSEDTIKHEWAHIAAPFGAAHGPRWREVAADFGARYTQYNHCKDGDQQCVPQSDRTTTNQPTPITIRVELVTPAPTKIRPRATARLNFPSPYNETQKAHISYRFWKCYHSNKEAFKRSLQGNNSHTGSFSF